MILESHLTSVPSLPKELLLWDQISQKDKNVHESVVVS